jgi:demethylmenaquinone methyltransferase/2-methoxy-6-polyprenyl-1,4-benzoquinol methylase
MSSLDELLDEQIRYYRARAGEYDDWWLRRGRYDRGEEANARWFAEAAQVRAALDRFAPSGRVLELACGTGLWTQVLAEHAEHLTALDSSPETLALCTERVGAETATYVEADLFAWEPSEVYDVCFFAFWLSHVPRERFAAFWELVARSLAPGGRVFLIDSARSELASARDHRLAAPGEQTMLRRLEDGREYNIVKHWFGAAELQRQIGALGWDVELHATPTFFVYGEASLARQ